MSGITGLGTNYNLPNYTGILFQLTPAETPFFSAIGGLSNGGQTQSTEFEWSTFDLRAAAQTTAVEGAAAPTAQERVRGNITNVVQIQQEKVSISYSKLAAVGQKAGSNNALPSNVQNEETWQVTQMLKQMVRDINYSFIQGAYQKPTDNTTARKTRGLLAAITTNRFSESTVLDATAVTTTSTNTITHNAHGLTAGQSVNLTGQVTTTTLPTGSYWVVNPTTNTFQVSLTKGGAPVAIDATGTVSVSGPNTALTVAILEDVIQSAYDNGGITDQATATILLGSNQKRQLTNAYATAYGKYIEQSRTVGGVNFQTIETNFGTFNVMLDRQVPKDTIAIVSLEQCTPVFLETPGKGHFFAEPLAKTGASDDVQLYGEVGLAYGNEKAHGVVTGLAL